MSLKKPLIFETTFSRYTSAAVIGEGGTGRVYEATDDAGGLVAIKVLDPLKAQSVDRRKRFKNELLFGGRNQHKNVLTVIDHGPCEIGGKRTVFYVMPRYESTLRSVLNAGLKPPEVLAQFAQILDGVEAAHLQRVIHRDLKPENILHNVTTGLFVVADFGVAAFAQEELYTAVETKPSVRLANFQYAAPEQRSRNKATDERTDIYALGLILNEMFTGEIAQGTGFKAIGSVSPEFAYVDGIVDLMIRQVPAERPISIDAIKRELRVRGNEFIERQRLDRLRQAVVPETELVDAIARDPIRIVDADWDRNMLTLRLSQAVNPEWVQAIQGSYSRSSAMGKGPERFSFQGDKATISVQHDDVQRVIDYFKTWLAPAHQIYVDRLKAKLRAQQERQRQELENEIRLREQRSKVLSTIRI